MFSFANRNFCKIQPPVLRGAGRDSGLEGFRGAFSAFSNFSNFSFRSLRRHDFIWPSLGWGSGWSRGKKKHKDFKDFNFNVFFCFKLENVPKPRGNVMNFLKFNWGSHGRSHSKRHPSIFHCPWRIQPTTHGRSLRPFFPQIFHVIFSSNQVYNFPLFQWLCRYLPIM